MARTQSRSSGRRRGKSNVISVDFTDVESAGTIADGWARAVVKSAEPGESKEGNPKVTVVWKVSRGKEKANVYDEISLQPQALWRFKSMLEACGYAVEDSAMDIPPDDIVDLECDVQVVNDDSYDGKDRPKIAAYAALGSHTDKGGGKKKSKDADEEEDDQDDQEEDEPRSRRGRAARDEEEGEDDDQDDRSSRRRSRKDRDEDEEEEEEDEPRRGKRKSRDDDEEEDSEEDDEPRAKRKGKETPKLRSGDRVTFEHRKKTLKGTVVAIEDDVVVVETADGSEYEVGHDEVEAA